MNEPASKSLSAGQPPVTPGSDRPVSSPGVASHARAAIGGQVVACTAALLGAWVAAGSLGLMAHPLRRSLLWIALGCALLAAGPLARSPMCHSEDVQPKHLAAQLRRKWVPWAAAVLGIIVVLWLAASPLPPLNVMAPAALLLMLAVGLSDASRRAMATIAAVVAVFAIYRSAYASAGVVWIAANHVGQWLGNLAAAITGWPVCIGATMAGLDFLIPMLLLGLLAPLRIGRPLGGRLPVALQALGTVLLVVLCHLLHQVLLSGTGAILDRYPQLRPGSLPPDVIEKLSPLEKWLRDVLVWNFPLVAAAVHCALAGLLLWVAMRFANSRGEAAIKPVDPRVERPLPAGADSDRIDSPAVSLALERLADQSCGVYPSGERTVPARWLAAAMVTSAVVFAAVGNLWWHRPDVHGKKVVIYQEGFLNWLRPQHGQYGRLSIGMYGMLPSLLRSYGMKVLVSDSLSEEDLSGARAVVLIYPNKPWQKGQLSRLWRFVHEGGSLLVLGEHTVEEEPQQGGGARFNDVLRPIGVRVAFDSATFAIGGWLHSYEAIWHPTTTGLGDQQNEFGVVIGASLGFPEHRGAVGSDEQSPSRHDRKPDGEPDRPGTPAAPSSAQAQAEAIAAQSDFDCEPGIDCPVEPAAAQLGTLRWPARPLIVGRWGWADPGDPAAGASKMGNHLYDPGERLGDLVLAAEEPLGKGRIVVFGDTSLLTNSLTINCHEYVSRLLAYLVDPGGWTQTTWRQICGVLAALVLAGLILWRPTIWPALAAVLALSMTLAVCSELSWRNWEITPDCKTLAELSRDAPENRPPAEKKSVADQGDSWVGKRPGPNPPAKLAYVDAAHLNRYSFESWRDEGTAGLCLTLMRNGYLTLTLSRLTEERLLERIAPEEAPADIKPPRPDEPEDEDVSLARQELKRWRIKAQLYVVIAPDRRFTRQEREIVKRFVRCGGLLIWTVGYEDVGPSREMLDELGFRVGELECYEGTLGPPPIWRYFKLPYLYYPDGRARNFVRFHSGWPVECDCPKHRMSVVAAHPEDGPMIVVRNYGRGRVAVIGDSGFALNKNLEREDGRPFDMMYENADFWRWFLAWLEDAPQWIPPVPKPIAQPAGEQLPPELLLPEQPPPGAPPEAPKAPTSPKQQPDQRPSGPLLVPPDGSGQQQSAPSDNPQGQPARNHQERQP